jgi:thiamine biosynthesis protein ThiS
MINGEGTQIKANTIEGLVLELDLPVNKLAIEHNLIIVPKSLYGSTVINDDDLIEIVHFVGGG